MALMKRQVDHHPEFNGAHLNGDDKHFVPVKSEEKSSRTAEAERKRARTVAKQQQVAERIAAATTELSSSVTEAVSAVDELKKAMQEVSSGATEASGAAQESLAAMTVIATNVVRQKQAADTSRDKSETMRTFVAGVSAEVEKMISSVNFASDRQVEAVKLAADLDKQAANISEIVKAVMRIADQTNLLALNAAIEAARAGQHGKGFAVVADEVRTLAETSEKSARDIQTLVTQVNEAVKEVSAGIEASSQTAKAEVEKGRNVASQLLRITQDLDVVISGAQEIAVGAAQMERAAKDGQKGSEVIANAAEEQSTACEEASKTIEQQVVALNQSEKATEALAGLSDELRSSTDITRSAESVASAAEELSSAIEEISSSSKQIFVALGQISKGAQQQASAGAESLAASTQIEKSAQMSDQRARAAVEKGQAMSVAIADNKKGIDEMIEGLSKAVDAGRRSGERVTQLELVARRIDKIVDSIATVSIQTNMLAVNGAIEAARAGEYGKGFVVVATDIRNLAHDSAENAERIKDLVKNIQDQIDKVRKDLDETTVVSVSEVEKARAITTSLKTVEGDVKAILTGNEDVVKSSGEILTAITQAKTGIGQISTVADQAEKKTAQASASAKQQEQAAQQLAEAIEEISSLADSLQQNA